MLKRSIRKVAPAFRIAKRTLKAPSYELESAGFCVSKGLSNAGGRFKGRSIIVTGAAGNFGTACAERFASEGANVALWDIMDASEVREKLKKANPNVEITSHMVDITKEDVVQKATDDVAAAFGDIHMLFNNAGYQGDFAQCHEYDIDDFRRVIDINIAGQFITLKSVANKMMTQATKGGSIVNTASMAAHGAPCNMIAYGTSKAGVEHMTKIAAKDLAPFNIRVNSVSPAFIGPGFMWSRQIELQAEVGSQYYDANPEVVADQMIGGTCLRRYGVIEEVIGPVSFLLSDDASYLTGVDIQITGGLI